MKVKHIILLLVILFFNACSSDDDFEQNKQLNEIIETIYYGSGDITPNQIHISTYLDNKIKSKTRINYLGGVESGRSELKYVYNSSRLLESIIYTDDTEVVFINETYEYDNQNRLILIKFIRADSEIIYITNITYNLNNTLTLEYVYNGVATNPFQIKLNDLGYVIDDGRFIYEYEDGNVTIMKRKDSNVIYASYTYDKNRKQVAEFLLNLKKEMFGNTIVNHFLVESSELYLGEYYWNDLLISVSNSINHIYEFKDGYPIFMKRVRTKDGFISKKVEYIYD